MMFRGQGSVRVWPVGRVLGLNQGSVFGWVYKNCSGVKGSPSTIEDAFISKVCEKAGDRYEHTGKHRSGICVSR